MVSIHKNSMPIPTTKDSEMESLEMSDKEGEHMKEETTGGDCE